MPCKVSTPILAQFAVVGRWVLGLGCRALGVALGIGRRASVCLTSTKSSNLIQSGIARWPELIDWALQKLARCPSPFPFISSLDEPLFQYIEFPQIHPRSWDSQGINVIVDGSLSSNNIPIRRCPISLASVVEVRPLAQDERGFSNSQDDKL